MKIVEANIQSLVDKHCSGGRMGHVKFRKADDSIRSMSFIQVSPIHVKGDVNTSNTKARREQSGQVMVYDIKAKGIRSFKAARVLELSLGGKVYTR